MSGQTSCRILKKGEHLRNSDIYVRVYTIYVEVEEYFALFWKFI